MNFKIVAISDLHYGCSPHPGWEGKFAHVFALRTVHRLNETIKPDAVLLMGDLLDDPTADDAIDKLTELKEIFDLLQCPTIAIPGNHDPSPEVFYEIFNRQERVTNIGPVRFSTFLDHEEPEWNARRMQPELDRMASIREDGFAGPVVAVQHVTAVPPGTTDCCFNYVNMDAVMTGMQSGQITLTVGGHYHPGTALIREQDSAYLGVPAMCEAPFRFTEIHLPLDRDIDKIEIRNHRLQIPPELGLVDLHSHTQFAYCSENVHTELSAEFAGVIGLSGLAFTEHSGQLNYDQSAYWSGEFCRRGLATTQGAQGRMPEYWTAALQAQKDAPVKVLVGFEVDSDFNGAQVLLDGDRQKAQILCGAVHFLPESVKQGDCDRDQLAREFMAVHETFVASGIHILVHPFRLFRGFEEGPPTWLFEPLAHLLKTHSVASEINFHHNKPQADFVRICIEMGVRLSFGSDAHNLYEIGEFERHLRFLEHDVGYRGELCDVMFSAL